MNYRDALINSICTQKINYMRDNIFTDFDVRINVHHTDAVEILRASSDTELQLVRDADTLNEGYLFCGHPLKQSWDIKEGTYTLEIIVAHQVAKTIKLLW